MKRKICILTQPLYTNYGGILQAYALQKVLRNMGHDVVTDEGRNVYYSFFYRFLIRMNHMVCKCLLGRRKDSPFWIYLPSIAEKKYIAQHTRRFIKENIKTIRFFNINKKPSKNTVDQFDTFIVGSDQVWRTLYGYVPNYYLDFVEEKTDIKRIAYAASFGTDEWEYSPALTEQCMRLAKKFDSLSVREDSGVDICRKYLDVDAVHVLDPTLLLSKDDYLSLIDDDNNKSPKKGIFTYILDQSVEKKDIVLEVEKILKTNSFNVMPREQRRDGYYPPLEDCVYPSVSEWLQGFRDADFIVTDSFHGTVFSIIFNKPFISIVNSTRGISRFKSLLKLFGLSDRLVNSKEEIDSQLINTPINYSQIQEDLSKYQNLSMAYLNDNL